MDNTNTNLSKQVAELEAQKRSFLGCKVLVNTKNHGRVEGIVVDIRLSAPEQEQILVLGFVSMNGTKFVDEKEVELMAEDILALDIVDYMDTPPRKKDANEVQCTRNLHGLSQKTHTLSRKLSRMYINQTKKINGSSLDVFIPKQVKAKHTANPRGTKLSAQFCVKGELTSSTLEESVIKSIDNLNLNPKESSTVPLKCTPSKSTYFPDGVRRSVSPQKFEAKYYPMTPEVKSTFWRRKSIPPPVPDIYPVGHPKNTGVQNVFTAQQHEIDYFDLQKYFARAVPCKDLLEEDNGNFTVLNSKEDGMIVDGETKDFVLNGGYLICATGEFVQALTPTRKELIMLQEVEVCSNFFLRASEVFGSCIFHLAISMANIKLRQANENIARALVIAGSSFQGASSIVAARFLRSKGVEVYLIPFESTTPFIGTEKADLVYSGAKIIHSLSEIKQIQFQVIIAGGDDAKSPTTSICGYRHWLKGSSVVLVDPPVIKRSYQSIMEGISPGLAESTCIVYSIRPSPCNFDEGSGRNCVKMFVASLGVSQKISVGEAPLEMIQIDRRKKRKQFNEGV